MPTVNPVARALMLAGVALLAALVLFVAAAGALGGPGAVKDVVVNHVPLVDEPDENENENENDDENEREPQESEGSDSAGPVATIAAELGDDEGPDEPIDCSIPDNADDSGCDKGDAQDSDRETGDSDDLELVAASDQAVPRGGVQTGAGGASELVAAR